MLLLRPFMYEKESFIRNCQRRRYTLFAALYSLAAFMYEPIEFHIECESNWLHSTVTHTKNFWRRWDTAAICQCCGSICIYMMMIHTYNLAKSDTSIVRLCMCVPLFSSSFSLNIISISVALCFSWPNCEHGTDAFKMFLWLFCFVVSVYGSSY